MTFPTAVYVGGFSVRLLTDTQTLHQDGLMGQWRPLESSIRYRDDCHIEVQAQTILHELCHAISSVVHEAGPYLTEEQVAPFSQGLFQVIRDNPDLIHCILIAGHEVTDED